MARLTRLAGAAQIGIGAFLWTLQREMLDNHVTLLCCIAIDTGSIMTHTFHVYD